MQIKKIQRIYCKNKSKKRIKRKYTEIIPIIPLFPVLKPDNFKKFGILDKNCIVLNENIGQSYS